MYGLLDLPWWGYIVATILMTQISIAGVTIYLHRHQAHRALDLHPVVSHFFRFWIWLTTAMLTPEWVAVHRKHHAAVETVDDPHSPKQQGIRKVLLEGTELYRKAARDRELVARYSHGTPKDWLERKVYSNYRLGGIALMFMIDVLLFGVIGITVWSVQMIWMPLFAAGTINGFGHWSGYRNFETPDASTNILPWGVFIGGEELHNNHHAFASSAKLSVRSWELDIGWLYIKVLAVLKLANIKRVVPVLLTDMNKDAVDMDTLRAVVSNRMQVMSNFAHDVMLPVFEDEMQKANRGAVQAFRRLKKYLNRDFQLLDEANKKKIQKLLDESDSMKVVYTFREELRDIWGRSTLSNEKLLLRLQQWCHEAEQTGIDSLQQFSQTMRTYTLPPMAAGV
ncbi:MAG: fatty acid desaturase [Gammaproteobacteria bacterium]|nr:fatty acid desaturase [Gammaproteobacteria bacterium]